MPAVATHIIEAHIWYLAHKLYEFIEQPMLVELEPAASPRVGTGRVRQIGWR
jgi:hypothetical protein